MRILIISSYLPYPLHSGGHIRLFNLLRYLSKDHEVTLVCEMREHQTQSDVAEVKKICREVYTVPRLKQWSLSNILHALFSKMPFLVVGHTNTLFQEKLSHLLSHETFDLIHVETFYVSQNLPPTHIPIVIAEHNIEYLVYQRYAENASSWLRPLLTWDVEKLRKTEEEAWRKAAYMIAVSDAEKQIIEKINKRTRIVSNGVSLSQFPFVKKSESGQKRLLFIGDFKWVQNRDAASWILKEIWPQIKKREDLVLWIVGKHIPKNILSYAGGRIIIDENAPDETAQIFEEAYLLLAPIRVGGGTSYKILEAMASGTPVITTSLGLEGIEAKEGEDILVADTPEATAASVKELVTDSKRYEDVAKNARARIEKTYSWDSIGKTLEDVYKEVCRD